MNKSSFFAREGYPIIGYSASISTLLAISAWILSSLVLTIAALFFVFITLFSLYFFRNPDRSPPLETDLVVAPADGTVIVAEKVDHSPLGTEAIKISIFMSVFNVHVNRVPFNGTVVEAYHDNGRFFDARKGKASFENERSCIILDIGNGVRIAFVQIAGLLARRIISYPQTGDKLVRGDRYGLIRFGSRVDVFLSANYTPLVSKGDSTTAGETILAKIR